MYTCHIDTTKIQYPHIYVVTFCNITQQMQSYKAFDSVDEAKAYANSLNAEIKII